MAEQIPTAKAGNKKTNPITGAINKPMTVVHDPDINLGHVLEITDAPNLGRDQTVLKQLSTSVNKSGAGKGGLSGGPGSGNGGPHYGAASNSGDNSGMHSAGTSSINGVPTSTQVGTRETGSAGTSSTSADENRQ